MVDGWITLGGVRQGEGLDSQLPNSRYYPSMAGVAPWRCRSISASVGDMPRHTGGARDLRRQRVLHGDDP